MTEDMFVTDRIYLDDKFERGKGLNRYRNWTRNEFKKGTNLYTIEYEGNSVGFVLFRIGDAEMTVLLWGLYEKYQHKGLGDLVPLTVYWFNENVSRLKSFTTKVSSNNKGIISKTSNLCSSSVMESV